MCLRMYTCFSYAILCTLAGVTFFFGSPSVVVLFCCYIVCLPEALGSFASKIKLKQSFLFSCGFVVSVSSATFSFKVYGIEWCLSDCCKETTRRIEQHKQQPVVSCLELSRSDFCPIYLIYCHCSSLALLVFSFLCLRFAPRNSKKEMF